MTGAFAGRNVGESFPVVSAVAKLRDEDGRCYAAYAHEALYDSNPAQTESLLSVHQSLRDTRNGIDDRARCERDIDGKPGLQMARFRDIKMPFFFDGTKCFFEVFPITEDELRRLPNVTITDGSAPYEPFARVHSRRRVMGSEGSTSQWKRRLGFAPDNVVSRTLDATTQLVPTVESETREIMRDHFQTRLPQLKVRRLNDLCYVDTFFSSIPSVRGYTCWNLFSFQRTGWDVVYLMRRRSQSPTTLPKMVAECGAPTRMKSDNAPEFKGKRWTSYLESLSVKSEYTEAHHPNQNLAERRGGALKAATVHMLTVTGAPLAYWCFALEYMCLVRTVLARRSLNWLTPHECHWGERPDISVFRFIFWQPVWYYQPRRAFPRAKMLKGRFLGVAPSVGDAFCFLILALPEDETAISTPQVLARSVVRPRYPREDAPDIVPEETAASGHSLTFYKNDETTILDDPPATDIEEVTDALSVVPTSPEELWGAVDSSDVSHDVLDDPFEDGIREVIGPPTKRPRSLVSDGSVPSFPDDVDPVAIPLTQGQTTIMETVPVLDAARLAHDAALVQVTDLHTSNTPPVGPPVATGTTASIGADPGRDDVWGESSSTPSGASVCVPVTQEDESVTPDILENVVHQLQRDADTPVDDDLFEAIVGHEWIDGVLMFRLLWKTDETTTVPFTTACRDFPVAAADYILRHKVGSPDAKYSGGRFTRWARQFKRTYTRVVRRLLRSARGYVERDEQRTHLVLPTKLMNGTRLIRRVAVTAPNTGGVRKRKKPGRISRPVQVKYGVEVPRNVRHAFELDGAAGNTLWADAIRKEVASLLALNCFEFHAPDYKPSSDYQWTTLSMIFEVKQDGRRKARLVAGGHMVDPRGINPRSTVVKGISVRLLDLIAHRDGLEVLCGDIGNAFITAECMEKVFSRAGPEFEEREDSVVLFKKALYGLRSSSRAFRAHFADFLRNMGFSASRYDRDVWMRKREDRDGYDYICTHVDDFKIVARNPSRWKEQISAAFLLKSIGPPSYYLGNDYNFSVEEKAWVLSCATYIKECIRRIESELDLDGTLWTHRTPLPEGCHPELDDSDLLSELGTRRYQMLIGMAQWACTIGRLDISFAVSSLSRFSAAPRTHHLELALHLFGYLKKNPNRRIVLDSRPLLVDDELRTESFHPDFLEDYPDATEDVGTDMPEAYGSELETSVFFDADHAHDHVTRRSISGIIVFVGSTPVIWQSKRQGCIATSTYCAEFVAMRSAVEEAISIRYMLRCLGIPVTKPTDMYGDNFGVIQSAEIPEGELKKKHIAISYHYVREAIAARIVNAHWCRSHENFADICTKALGATIFNDLVCDMMA